MPRLNLVPILLYVSCAKSLQSCLTLCNPVDCSTPGFPVLTYLLELAQMHVHLVDDAIQPSHPLNIHWKVKLKLQYFGYLMGRANLLEKSLMLGKTEGQREEGNRG